MKTEAIEKLVIRIEIELEAILSQGLASQSNWYALDRIMQIQECCEELLKGNELACVIGHGSEDQKAYDKLK